MTTNILEAARYILPIVLTHLSGKQKWRKGGFLCYTDENAETGAPILLFQIGQITRPGKATTYFRFVQEKVRRLRRNSKRGHVSSWESRDEAKQRYGGAIRVLCAGYLSFSGLPEKLDEALCLCVALRLGWISSTEAHHIAHISNNRFFVRLLAHGRIYATTNAD